MMAEGPDLKRRSAWANYSIGFFVVAVALVLRWPLYPLLGASRPYLTLFGAVALAVWLCRWRAAALGAIAGFLAANYFLVSPRNPFAFNSAFAVEFAAYALSTGLIIFVGEATHRASERAQREAAERKSAQEAELREKELLSTTLASIGDGVIVTDAQGRVTFLNAEAERLTGYRSGEAAGRPLPEIFRIINEQNREPAENPVDKVLRLGVVVGLANHTLLLRQDGTEIPIDDSAAPIRLPGGPLLGVVLVFRDFTEPRKAQQTSARLAAIVQFSGDAIFTKGLDGVIQTWNASAERLFGYRAEEIIGKPVATLIPPDRLTEEEHILGRLRQGQPSEQLETIRVAKNGKQIPVLVTVSPLKDAEGNVIGASKIIRDITDLVAAREALVREKELLSTTLASIGDGVIVTDPKGRVTFLNGEAERITGWKNSEAVSRPLPEIFRIVNEQTQQPVENPVEKVLRLGAVVGLANHTLLLAKDGRAIPIDDTAAPIRLRDGPLFGVVLVFRDFTARREAESELQTLALLPAQNPSPVLRVRGDGVLLFANPAAFEQLKGWNLHVGEAVPVDIRAAVANALKAQRTGLQEQKVGAQDYLVSIAPVAEAGYANLYWLDITELKRAEQALRQSEGQVAGLVASAMDAIIAVDETQRVVLFNPAAEQMFGWPAAEAVGGSLDRFIPSKFREAHRQHIERFGKTGVTSRRMGALGALSGVRRSGEEFPIEASISQMEVGGRTLFTVILRDVTERQRIEQALAGRARLLDLTHDAIFVRDRDERIIYWNRGAERMYGWKSDEALGKVPHELLQTRFPEPLEDIMAKVRRDSRWAGELVHRRRDGTHITVASRWSLDRVADGRSHPGVTEGPRAAGPFVMETNNDVSERKRAEQALREANEQLERAVEERTTKLREMIGELQHVSYAIVHDMRAPLRAMRAFAQMLEVDESSELRVEHARRIMVAASRLDRLIQDALNYNKAVLREMPLEPVDLSNLLRGLVETYPNLDSNIADIRIEGHLPVVLGNQALLTECFANLLDNAVKFVAQGTRPRVEIGSEARDGIARVWIQDNGIGIAKQAQQRLFGLFERLTTGYEGTGLGLAIVRKVVERMGGKVGAESELGKGSRFWVELKVVPSDEAPSAAQ